jgi:TP901 family phage tail tape measure protein
MESISLRLQAAFEGAAAYTQASNALRGLAAETDQAERGIAQLDAQGRQIQGLIQLEARLEASRGAMEQARREVDFLRRGMEQAGPQGAALFSADLAKAIGTVQRLGTAQTKLTTEIAASRESLKTAGIAVDRLADEQARLARETDTAKAALLRQTEALTEAARKQQALADIEDRLSRSLANAANLTRVADAATGLGRALGQTGFGLQEVVGKAIAFESAMADVRKVVDTSPERFAALTADIRALGRELPLTAVELAQIAAAGGQLGIAADQLDDFTRLAAKMGISFDLGAQQAGEALAKLSNVFTIPILEVEHLGDAINALGNTTAARERDIVDVLTRIGGTAKQFGLTAEQAAALSATLLAMGRPAEVAATGINALLSKLQTAAVQGDTFKAALVRLGVQADTLAQQIAANPQRALSEFLAKLQQLDKLARAEILTQLFGAEYQDDLALLLNGLGQYEAALNKVGDGAANAGAMQREFEERSKTTENQLKLLRNALDDLAVGLGTGLLPPLQAVAGALRDFAEAAPGVASAIGAAVLALGALGIAAGTVGRGFAVVSVALAEVGAALARSRLIEAGTGAALARLGLGATGLASGLTAAAGGAALLSGYALGKTFGDWAFGADEAAEAAARLAETQSRVEQKLALVREQTGLALPDMQAFNKAVEDGTLFLSEMTGEWTRVPPEVVKAREELERLKGGLADLKAEAGTVPDYLRAAFAELGEAIGPAFRVPQQEISADLKLLKVDAGEAANGIRTEFATMAQAFDNLALRSDVSARTVGLAARTLADQAKTTEEAQAAMIAMGNAYEAGRLEAEAFIPAADKLNKLLAEGSVQIADAAREAAAGIELQIRANERALTIDQARLALQSDETGRLRALALARGDETKAAQYSRDMLRDEAAALALASEAKGRDAALLQERARLTEIAAQATGGYTAEERAAVDAMRDAATMAEIESERMAVNAEAKRDAARAAMELDERNRRLGDAFDAAGVKGVKAMQDISSAVSRAATGPELEALRDGLEAAIQAGVDKAGDLSAALAEVEAKMDKLNKVSRTATTTYEQIYAQYGTDIGRYQKSAFQGLGPGSGPQVEKEIAAYVEWLKANKGYGAKPAATTNQPQQSQTTTVKTVRVELASFGKPSTTVNVVAGQETALLDALRKAGLSTR